MASFGFDASRHNAQAPGFSQAHDPFAGLSSGQNIDDALEFEDTYDGLGDNLEETGDAFNEDTFGGNNTVVAGGGGGGLGAFGASSVGKDFDFFGQTAKVAGAIDEEHARFNLLQPVAGATAGGQSHAASQAAPSQFQHPYPNQYQQAPQHASQHFGGPSHGLYGSSSSARPARSGYEKYQEPEPDMQVDAALWGVAPKKPATATPPASQAPKPPSGSRKILSLEEVEAAMRSQKKPATPAYAQQPVPDQNVPQQQQQHYQPPPPQQQHQHQQPIDYGYGAGVPPPGAFVDGMQPQQHPMAILQRPNVQPTPPGPTAGLPPFQQGPPPPQQAPPVQQPTHILQNQNRLSGGGVEGAPFGSAAFTGYPAPPHQHHRQTSSMAGGGPIITHPSQLAHLSEEEKAAYLEQEARRAKRNHKIFVLSKSNGLMTPQDKNFVTRIQLQQLVTATGNPNEHGTDEALKEDFYYQVLSQIRGTTRQHPSQPLNNFAQTYLFQTGGRPSNGRRFNRDRAAENHIQRMDQQVQRAVEAAKNRPKNRQLILAGTLGKISFSNAKTPKPLLNIKRGESAGHNGGAAAGGSGTADRPGSAHKSSRSSSNHNTGASAAAGAGAVMDRKAILGNIEKVYATLMEIEDHDRKMPPRPVPEQQNDEAQLQRFAQWSETMQQLTAQLWRELKVHEPIGAFPVHPFIAFLSVPKGKKAIPRVFRFLSHELRATLLTMIVVHLDQLDIVRQAQVNNGDTQVNAALRESIDLFIQTVINTLFNFMAELGLDLVTGVLGLVSNLQVAVVAKSRIGASMLTMILSRAELIKQASGGTPQQWQQWEATYTTFFDTLEPTLPHMFPGTVASSEDMYVWQLLAALGIGANPDQQQRLVLAVKDRVMDTVAVAKTLPADLATQRLQSVNLFMRSIGLDVELLQ